MTSKNKNKNKTKTRARARRARRQPALGLIERMIVDPCNGPVVPYAASQGGYVTRFKRTIKLHQVAANNNGYLVWFPDYHNMHLEGEGGNCLYFESANSADSPYNLSSHPLGTGTTGGQFTADPVYSWADSATCQDARTLAACIRLRYSGKLADAEGTIAAIREISATQFFNGSGAFNSPCSIDQLMTFAPEVERFNPEGIEIRYRPHDDTSVPRTSGKSSNTTTDRCFQLGVTGTVATSMPSGDVAGGEKRGIAIAWTGLNTGATSDVWVDFVKVVEWRPNTSSGMVETAPVTAVDSNTFGRALERLDHFIPSWQTATSAFPSALTQARDLIMAGNTAHNQRAGKKRDSFLMSAYRGTAAAFNSPVARTAMEVAPLLLGL